MATRQRLVSKKKDQRLIYLIIRKDELGESLRMFGVCRVRCGSWERQMLCVSSQQDFSGKHGLRFLSIDAGMLAQ